jgi:hypothetical protein
MHQNRVGKVFIAGVETGVVVPDLLQHRLQINPRMAPPLATNADRSSRAGITIL